MDSKTVDPTATQSEKERLELENLRLEHRKLESETGHLGQFGRSVWPMLASGVTVVIAIGALFLALQTWKSNQKQVNDLEIARQAQQEEQALQTALQLATATDSTAARRVSGLWLLGRFWDPSKKGRFDTVLANGLSSILVADPSPVVRMAAADVIGQAITREADDAVKRRRCKLLYGSKNGWVPGVVVAQQWMLLRSPPSADRNEMLEATRQAIRQNWEYLEDAQLFGVDLQGVQLHDANLKGAVLAQANLRQANLRGANLEGASLKDADLHCANVKGIRGIPSEPANFLEWAKLQGAVEMEDWQHQKWVKGGCPSEPSWQEWIASGSQVDSNGHPLPYDAHKYVELKCD